MITGEDDPDLSSMLRAGVGLDDDGDFDPTNLLSQPINFDDDIDELDINIDDEAGDNTFQDSTANECDSDIVDGDKNNKNYYDQDAKSNNETNDPRETYLRAPSPDSQVITNRRHHQDSYDHGRNEDGHSPRRHSSYELSPREYDPPPYKRIRSNDARRNSSAEHPRTPPPRGKQRRGGRDVERIAEVQQRIRQVQQQIHENMDDDPNGGMERIDTRQHSYRGGPGYSRHREQDRMYSDKYPEEPYYDGYPRERFSPRDSPHHGRNRSYRGIPSSMRDGGEAYGGDRPRQSGRRSNQQPLQQQHPGLAMMSHHQSGMHSHNDLQGNDNENGHGPQDRHHSMHPMKQLRNDLPVHNDNSHSGHGGITQQQYVLGGMSQSLNGMGSHGSDNNGNSNNNSTSNHIMQQQQRRPQHMRPTTQSYNDGMHNVNMNANNNGNMSRLGIQSMSDSLNGVNTPSGMDPGTNIMNLSRNGMDRSNNRGIQSMSASLNGMQNVNGSTYNKHNGMMNNSIPQQRGIQSMSASLNGMQQMNSEQNMHQSMNGMQCGYGGQHPGPQQYSGCPESMGMPMNRSMNGMQNMRHNHDGGSFPHQQQHHSINPMSASQHGMPNMNSSNQGGGFNSHQQHGGSHPLQGMSQSLNGASNTPYGGHHQSIPNKMNNISGDHGMKMSINSKNMNTMDQSNNNMGRSMNGSMNGIMNGNMNGNMNASNNGISPMLNNSNVPSASLLNQVSNLANLPNLNRSVGGTSAANNPSMMQGATGGQHQPDATTKLSRKLMEAMKRTASSRKLIKDLNIAAMLRGDLKSPASSSSSSSLSKLKSVVKAKRKASRQSYTKSRSEAASSREFVKAQKNDQQPQQTTAV